MLIARMWVIDMLVCGSCQFSTPIWRWFVWSDLSLRQQTRLWRPRSPPTAAIPQPVRKQPRARRTCAISHWSPFFNLAPVSPARPTPRGTFCWRPWRSTTRWGQTKSPPRWARSTTLLPPRSTTRASSTGRRARRESPAASAWTGTHTWRKRGCGDVPVSSKSKSPTWPMWTPSTDGHG